MNQLLNAPKAEYSQLPLKVALYSEPRLEHGSIEPFCCFDISSKSGFIMWDKTKCNKL